MTKKYDTAKTPYRRILQTETIPQYIKDALNQQYDKLDPVLLLEKLKQLQTNLFQHAWSSKATQKLQGQSPLLKNETATNIEPKSKNENNDITQLDHYRHTGKTDKRKGSRNYRTRKDPFERVWDEIKLKLELNPEISPKALLDGLIVKYPDDYKPSHLRTLQRKVSLWSKEQHDLEAKLRVIMQTNKA